MPLLVGWSSSAVGFSKIGGEVTSSVTSSLEEEILESCNGSVNLDGPAEISVENENQKANSNGFLDKGFFFTWIVKKMLIY